MFCHCAKYYCISVMYFTLVGQSTMLGFHTCVELTNHQTLCPVCLSVCGVVLCVCEPVLTCVMVIVRCRYNGVKFSLKILTIDTSSLPWGCDVGCLLGVQALIYIMLQSLQYCLQYHTILNSYNGTLQYLCVAHSPPEIFNDIATLSG